MKYIIWCDLVFSWVGERDEKTNNFLMSVTIERAKKFSSREKAIDALDELPKHWHPHILIQECANGK